MTEAHPANSDASFLDGGGELGALMRAHDWASTSLGPPESWAQSLKTAVRIILTSRQPFWIGYGPDLVYLYNDAYKSIIGGKHPAALGSPFNEVWSEIWDIAGPLAEHVMTRDEGTYIEAQRLIMQRHGYEEETYYTFSYSPIPGDDGRPGGLICANTEDTHSVISERQLATLRELAARTASARREKDVLQLAADALTTNDRDLPFVAIFRGATPVLATVAAIDAATAEALPLPQDAPDCQVFALDDLAGTLPTGAWPRPPRQAAVLPIGSAGPEGRGLLVVGLNPYRRFDASYRGFLQLAAGQIDTALTNASAYEQERRRAESLAELDRAKTAFFSNVSHEFRTPLTLMLGPIEDLLVRQDGQVVPADREVLRVVQRNGQRLLKLVNTLLDFARIEAGRAQATYEATDLGRFTAELASNFRSACERAGLQLDVACATCTEPAYVDREMWEKIVFNLVSNAFKFTFEGRIVVSLSERASSFVLEVVDTGTGIPASELPRMFERFHRVEGARGRSHEGSGIGLALVHELVKLHGAKIDVRSELSVGTCFTVSVPKGHAHLPAERRRTASTSVTTAARADAFVEEAMSWLDGLDDNPATVVASPARADLPRVLLVDDNADLREYALRLLGEHYTVEAVGDGVQALAAARARRPDIVVSDIMMPNLDGFGLVRELRADDHLSTVPIILLSARAGEEARLEGLGRGADDYLVKPFSARELLIRVGALLQSTALRREAEEAMRNSERRLREFADTAPSILWASEPDGNCAFLSRGWRQFTGQDERAGLGFGWTEAVHPEDRRHTVRRFLDANRDQCAFTVDCRLRHSDGEYRWALAAGRPRFDAGGEFLGFVGSIIDVHEHKMAEQAVRESETRFRALTSATSDAVYRMSPDWTEMRQLHGREFIADVIEPNRSWIDEYIPPEHQAHVTQVISEAIATKTPFELEHRIIRADGTLGWTYSRAIPILDDRGEIIEWFGAASDVSPRRAAEEALQEADRRKDEFLATLSHELRNPLAPLRNSLHLLRLTADADGRTRALYEMMERQVNHLVRLVDDLMEMARINRGSFELRRQPITLQSVLQNAVETAQPLIDAAGHRLEVSFPDMPVPLHADPVRLAQLFANLLNNAAKYTASGGTISVEGRTDGADGVVVVADNGDGIPAAALPNLFEMFSQAGRTSNTSQGGLGIGLALARRVAEMHGGTISAHSDGPGLGSRFTVRLPIAGAIQGAAPEGARAGEPPRQTVLVVDDNRDAAESLGMLLEALGMDVQVAYDGRRALETFAAHAPRIVFLDIGMPVMDGYQVATEIRALDSRVHLVALTGWGQEEDRRKAEASGFDDHLVKPADLESVRALLSASADADRSRGVAYRASC